MRPTNKKGWSEGPKYRRIADRYFRVFVRVALSTSASRVRLIFGLPGDLSVRAVLKRVGYRPTRHKEAPWRKRQQGRAVVNAYKPGMETTWPLVDLHNEPGDLHIRPRTH